MHNHPAVLGITFLFLNEKATLERIHFGDLCSCKNTYQIPASARAKCIQEKRTFKTMMHCDRILSLIQYAFKNFYNP